MYLVECKLDAPLVESLTLTSRKNIRQAGSKSELLRKLTERYVDFKGVVDEDPWSVQPPHLRKFREKENLISYGLKVMHQSRRNNTLVILCPRLEEWILEASREADIGLERYSLPDDPARLHQHVNIQIDQFQKVVEKLRTESNRLKKLERYLRRDI